MRSLNVNLRTLSLAAAVIAFASLSGNSVAHAQEDPPETESVQIDSFTASWLFGDVWEFSGRVTGGPTLSGLTIEFGELIAGKSTTTNTIGEFALEIDLNGQQGTASAVAYSVDSIPSDMALTEAGNP